MSSSIQLPGRTRIISAPDGREGSPLRTLYIDVRFVEECADLWRTGEFAQLGISDYENPGLSNLDFLASFPLVSKLHLRLGQKVAIYPLLAHATSLQAFFANDDLNGLERPSQFPRLQELGQHWSSKTDWGGSLDSLKKLSLVGFRPKSNDLAELPTAPNLVELNLLRGKFESLRAISRFGGLRTVMLGNIPNLVDISELKAAASLMSLSIENCKKVAGLPDAISQLPIERLVYINGGVLDSLAFVRLLNKLKFFVLMDTDVLDGNMLPLVAHPALKHVAFTKRKNFSHSEAQVLKLRGG